MRTPASFAGHPVHPLLIVFPVGLFIFSLICDVISLFSINVGMWAAIAFVSMAGGFIGALAAAIPGFIDYLSISDPGTKKIATFHMALNLTAVVLYGINIWMRMHATGPSSTPLILSIVSVGILGISGWLGGSLVYKHGVGVNVDKP